MDDKIKRLSDVTATFLTTVTLKMKRRNAADFNNKGKASYICLHLQFLAKLPLKNDLILVIIRALFILFSGKIFLFFINRECKLNFLLPSASLSTLYTA